MNAHESAYTRGVRSVFPALLAALLAVAMTADRVACFDGCTDQGQEHTADTEPSVCALCLGWHRTLPPIAETPRPQPAPALIAAPQPDYTAHLPVVERPPRAA
jgi:hypothetical protein